MAGIIFVPTLASLISALLIGLALLLAHVIIKCRIALWQFKRRSKNLPIYDDIQLFGNTIFTLGAKPDICHRVDEAHKRLGKTFGWLSMARYGVHTTDLDLIKRIVIDRGEINRTRTDFPLKEIEESLLMVEDDQWRKLRRHFAPAFKSTKFKTPNVMEEIDNSIQMLIEHIERRVDASEAISSQREELFEADDMLHKFSLQVIFSCFYKQYNLIDFSDEHCYWVRVIDEMVEAVHSNIVPKIALVLPSLNPILDWLIRHLHPQGAWRKTIIDFIRKQTRVALEARRQLGVVLDGNRKKRNGAVKIDKNSFELQDGTKFKRNMIDHVIDKHLDGKLTENEFFNSSFLILFAADKTTTDAMIHLMYLLATHPEEQEQCREAIKREGYGTNYLGWCINEALRLLPPAPAGCSRTIKRDLELDDGHVLPAGSFVICSTFTIHRLREYWGEDANEFRPTRWTDTKHHHPLQFIPFGYGPRGCLGREFALFEIRKLFSALLTKYKFESRHRDDVYIFGAVYLTTIIPNSKTVVTIRRLSSSTS